MPAHRSTDTIAAPAEHAPLFSSYANDADMAELLGSFVKSLARHADELQQLMQSSDLSAVRRLAHQLKGAAGGYGFGKITDAARTVEDHLKASADGKSADVTNLAAEVADLIALCRRATAAKAPA